MLKDDYQELIKNVRPNLPNELYEAPNSITLSNYEAFNVGSFIIKWAKSIIINNEKYYIISCYKTDNYTPFIVIFDGENFYRVLDSFLSSYQYWYDVIVYNGHLLFLQCQGQYSFNWNIYGVSTSQDFLNSSEYQLYYTTPYSRYSANNGSNYKFTICNNILCVLYSYNTSPNESYSKLDIIYSSDGMNFTQSGINLTNFDSGNYSGGAGIGYDNTLNRYYIVHTNYTTGQGHIAVEYSTSLSTKFTSLGSQTFSYSTYLGFPEIFYCDDGQIYYVESLNGNITKLYYDQTSGFNRQDINSCYYGYSVLGNKILLFKNNNQIEQFDFLKQTREAEYYKYYFKNNPTSQKLYRENFMFNKNGETFYIDYSNNTLMHGKTILLPTYSITINGANKYPSYYIKAK